MSNKSTQFVIRSDKYTDPNRNYNGLDRKSRYSNEGGLFKKNHKIYRLPIMVRKYIREWCEINCIIMGIHEKYGDYIIWNDIIEGKEKLIRLYLNYFKSSKGVHFVFAHNQMFKRNINITSLMVSMKPVNEALEAIHFEDRINGTYEHVSIYKKND